MYIHAVPAAAEMLTRDFLATACGDVCGLELRDFMSFSLACFYHTIVGTSSGCQVGEVNLLEQSQQAHSPE